MDRKEFIRICDLKLKLIRTEYSLNQEEMSSMLGISKKTLVEIEKGRSSLGWTGSVALCCIFGESEIITANFGGKPTEVILALAFNGNEPQYPGTMGGKVWWQTVLQGKSCLIQQNIILQHYRLLDADGKRLAASFELEDLMDLYNRLSPEG